MSENLPLPADIEAERYALAAMIQAPHGIDMVADLLVPEHFHRPAHQIIYRAMIMMHSAGEPIDPITLRDWITKDGEVRSLGGLANASMYLAELYGLPVVAASATYYAHIVHELGVRRAILELSVRMQQAAYDRELSEDQLFERYEDFGDDLGKIDRLSDSLSYVDAARFCGDETARQRPVIPGLLDHEDRVVVVGGEGRGKSVLGAQMGFAAAAGCHPFEPEVKIPPQRVLIGDFENPSALLQRRWRWLAGIAEGYPGWNPSNLMLLHRPGGIDITNPRERHALTEAVRKSQPDLLILGPVYKMILGTSDDERSQIRAHGRLTAFIDRLRERYGCAVWLEHHAPIGPGDRRREMRPEGSAVWLRWPEFGISLYKASKAHGGDTALEVSQFRGHREEGRRWPLWLTRSSVGWPWEANYDRRETPPPPPSYYDPGENE